MMIDMSMELNLMTDDIVTRLRELIPLPLEFADESAPAHLISEAADEIARLRKCLQHAIDHIGKWQLFTTEEKQALIAEYEQAVRGD